jgi:hypothetical protein
MSTIAIALIATLFTPFVHVRAIQPALQGALEAGIARSETFRGLVDRLNASDVVVHVMFDENAEASIAGHLTFATTAGGVRYVRIAIAPRFSGCDLIAILGHELRHAVEIASEPSIHDQASMAAFYAAIGERRAGPAQETFDTAEAIAVGQQIRREALGSGRSDGPHGRP